MFLITHTWNYLKIKIVLWLAIRFYKKQNKMKTETIETIKLQTKHLEIAKIENNQEKIREFQERLNVENDWYNKNSSAIIAMEEHIQSLQRLL